MVIFVLTFMSIASVISIMFSGVFGGIVWMGSNGNPGDFILPLVVLLLGICLSLSTLYCFNHLT